MVGAAEGLPLCNFRALALLAQSGQSFARQRPGRDLTETMAMRLTNKNDAHNINRRPSQNL